ncbi:MULTISPECIES: hypothetical protein [Nocardia]|uniref:hypothetical protein n=1 Tax=Nocardia TaxID=1817 RepID=UPI0024548FFE|nr:MULTISPECIES: hypothetical protein [Nocardia]
MTKTTLMFDIPEQCREVFAHELELLQYQMEPVIEWLERHGGRMHSVSHTDTL